MLNPIADVAGFARRVIAWQRESGRHDLPWQGTRDPYRIWLSEIMLQQTQVATVAGYYTRFLQRFPDVASLARASQDDVMPYWAGLGYYARARNLHRCARTVLEQYDGRFPHGIDDLGQLPGIGRSTAAAIAVFAFGARHPIMDGNVKRVFTRYFGIAGDTSRRAVEQSLWAAAHSVVAAAPAKADIAAYIQGLMDLGASLCSRTRPRCDACPLASDCYARRTATQGDFPTRKNRKARPERHCQMLILRRDGCVLLEQRPAPGIWGGLWSLPQYDDPEAMRTALWNWGLAPAQASPLEGLQHAFSHFTLHIEPWLAQAGASSLAQPAPAQAWRRIDELDSAALPAPVKKLLARVF